MTSTQATVAIGMITLRLLLPDPSWLEVFAALLTFRPLPLGAADDDEELRVVVVKDVVEGVDDVTGTGAAINVVPAARGAVVVAAGAGAGAWTEAETEPTGAVVETATGGTAAIRAGIGEGLEEIQVSPL
jgi:hypothetical protein